MQKHFRIIPVVRAMRFLKSHLEWTVFATGLILLALMDPATAGVSFCLFDAVGINFCPGEGLGHSIAYTFRGNFEAAIQAHFAGPIAILILGLRILHIWKQLLFKPKTKGHTNG